VEAALFLVLRALGKGTGRRAACEGGHLIRVRVRVRVRVRRVREKCERGHLPTQ